MYFLQSPSVITKELVLEAMTNTGLAVDRLESVIEILGNLTFLGFEVAPNRYEYIFDEQDTQKIRTMAAKTVANSGLISPRYQIHPAFHSYLEVTGKADELTGQLPIPLSVD
ncbi:hypothetical protein [Edaphobacter modestus]|uniref:Uncharacterized protein n=1 Tax=Edaphobacter modestus TaxID=388466 RepID=A0A4Q7YFK5_9BACT|nr:hypothetical protein [Edaphobacter modestus]RZU35788.1 hypothetical protein BDD14_5895 [Edaphobacter modestus]